MDAIPGQIALDIDEMIREAERDAAPAWTGAPLRFTADYWTPAELEAAAQRWRLEHGNTSSRPRSHTWTQTLTGQPLTVPGHRLHVLSADTRPIGREYLGPGALLYQANCPACRWHHISDSENAAVEALHDHGMPGWADLPVMPARLSEALGHGSHQATTKALAWLEANYPSEWQHPGAPIRTSRRRGATRHVPGLSPFGGYDITAEISTPQS